MKMEASVAMGRLAELIQSLPSDKVNEAAQILMAVATLVDKQAADIELLYHNLLVAGMKCSVQTVLN